MWDPNHEVRPTGACFSGRAKAEDKKLIKELALEVLTLKVPFRNLSVALFLNPSLVAEANFLG
jgi:hypothetical protein